MPFENEARTRWNAENYTQVKFYAEPKLAAAFKVACTAAGVSMASVMSKFMAEYCNELPSQEKKKPPITTELDYSTRGKRRSALRRITAQIEALKDAEEGYRDRIPENLQGSERYEAAERDVSLMETALESLSEAYT